MSLLKKPPTEEERQLVHYMFLSISTTDLTAWSSKRRRRPENSVLMKDTTLQTVITCHPEDGSVYNKIFGGFVMRKAHELASTTASVFSRGHVGLCRSIDDVVFLRSVDIGDELHLQAMVVYTNGSDVQVYVRVEKINPELNTYEMTNDFHFIFSTVVDNLPSVMPSDYSEAMMYLRGRRHYEG
ncbi:hypothetical protein RRG08_058728 [Elysia crispata]|uniref:HotDog ACOT-type domain-containing protein n=1 Tax=Elysia crispata TaxID=231223 RepID=A0AAE1D6Q6_9GAST|nr:hypothetical protein RRG08_058728 [Elysia crispata]